MVTALVIGALIVCAILYSVVSANLRKKRLAEERNAYIESVTQISNRFLQDNTGIITESFRYGPDDCMLFAHIPSKRIIFANGTTFSYDDILAYNMDNNFHVVYQDGAMVMSDGTVHKDFASKLGSVLTATTKATLLSTIVNPALAIGSAASSIPSADASRPLRFIDNFNVKFVANVAGKTQLFIIPCSYDDKIAKAICNVLDLTRHTESFGCIAPEHHIIEQSNETDTLLFEQYYETFVDKYYECEYSGSNNYNDMNGLMQALDLLTLEKGFKLSDYREYRQRDSVTDLYLRYEQDEVSAASYKAFYTNKPWKELGKEHGSVSKIPEYIIELSDIPVVPNYMQPIRLNIFDHITLPFTPKAIWQAYLLWSSSKFVGSSGKCVDELYTYLFDDRQPEIIIYDDHSFMIRHAASNQKGVIKMETLGTYNTDSQHIRFSEPAI